MTIYDWFLILSVGAGFMMAFNLGANDVANSMATSVGAKAINIKQAVFIAGTLNFLGAVFLGANVTSTIKDGIINSAMIPDPKVMMVGMFAALLCAGIWVLVATLTALPVSSTHSIVGAILGFGFVAGGPGVVNWGKMTAIVLSWIISPFFGGLIAFGIFSHIRKHIFYSKHVLEQTRKWAPIWITLTAALVALSFFYKTPFGKKLPLIWEVKLAVVAGLCFVVWLFARHLVTRMIPHVEDGADGVETIFRKMQVGTACYVAISQGANDVANAVGPVAAIYMIARGHGFVTTAEVPFFLLVVGGAGIAIGTALLGYKVMRTVGEKITVLTNTRGFSVEFGAAATVLMASNLGMPVSTTHAAVGSVVGVGLARGFKAVDFRVLGRIMIYWVLTVPISAFSCIVLFQILKWLIL
ncbi:MAG: inorganic phosphate transporter [Desulfovibrionaceae bacterium]